MRKIRKNHAVSEIVGTALLLGIAISLFVIVQVIAMSFPFNPNPPSARLVANIKGETIFISHHGGESLLLDKTTIIFTIDGNSYFKNASEILNATLSNGDKFWNIGEKVNYTYTPATATDSLADFAVNIMVIDSVSGLVIMTSTIQE
jgi:hypothetical protein